MKLVLSPCCTIHATLDPHRAYGILAAFYETVRQFVAELRLWLPWLKWIGMLVKWDLMVASPVSFLLLLLVCWQASWLHMVDAGTLEGVR